MSYVIEIRFEIHVGDTGDRTYEVSTRQGSSGDIVPTLVLHDSHFADDAFAALKRATRAAIAGRTGELTPAYPDRCEKFQME